jgi:hypothetical protein
MFSRQNLCGLALLVTCLCLADTAVRTCAAADKEEEPKVNAFVQESHDDGSRLTQVIEERRMIRISERPGVGITIIVVDTVRNSDKIYRYNAKNESILQAKDPKGYAIYERYVKNQVEVPAMTELDAGRLPGGNPEEEFRKRWQQSQQEMLRQFGGQHRNRSFSQQGSYQGNARSAFSRSSARASASARSSSSSSSSSNSSNSSSSSSSGASGARKQ